MAQQGQVFSSLGREGTARGGRTATGSAGAAPSVCSGAASPPSTRRRRRSALAA
jgi:hypothetical protein